jgi:chromosome segregation ATPase
MTDRQEETESVHVEVPKSTKELAKEQLEHGGLTRVVREELERIAHGSETSEKQRLQDHLQDLRDERKHLKTERTEIDNQIDDLEVKIERIENKLDNIRDREGEYEGALRMIEEMMEKHGMNVDVGHGKVEDAARVGNCTPEDVIADLKDRNPQYGPERFSEGV